MAGGDFYLLLPSQRENSLGNESRKTNSYWEESQRLKHSLNLKNINVLYYRRTEFHPSMKIEWPFFFSLSVVLQH